MSFWYFKKTKDNKSILVSSFGINSFFPILIITGIVAAIVIPKFLSCNNAKSVNQKANSIAEYVIVFNKHAYGYEVVRLSDQKSFQVQCIIQTDNDRYLPISQYLPSFNHKVVTGVFTRDSCKCDSLRKAFKVTHHLRDTAFATVGQ